jgi:hypothetical protein
VKEPEPIVSPKDERISEPEMIPSPILPQKQKTKSNLTKEVLKSKVGKRSNAKIEASEVDETDNQSNIQLDETRVLEKLSTSCIEMDKTVFVPNGAYTQKNVSFVLKYSFFLPFCHIKWGRYIMFFIMLC